LIFAVSGVFFEGCVKYYDHEKYERPDWLPGKLYTAVETQEDLTKFAECLRTVGLDTILNVSGCWTVFAPTDEAMNQYLAENQYASISDIPKDKLERLTKFHIIQNPWTLDQLQTLSVYGWTDPLIPWSNPNAYKRQTMLKEPNQKFWIKKKKNSEIIVMDSTMANDYKKVFVQSRKYAPVFYDRYFEINGLSPEDYSFYFNRPYEPGNIYYAGAMVIRSNLFAENGFVHVVDKVVEPMLNAREMLERDLPGESYKSMLELIYIYYPSFNPNITATLSQPELTYGGFYDTLFDLSFTDLAFDLHEELTGDIFPGANYTLSDHNGMFIPTDNAFQIFLDEVLTIKSGYPHWPNLESVPRDLISIIVDHHFIDFPLYPSYFYWGISDLNEEDILRKEYGSNCTFLGIDSYIPSRLFTSVTGPVFLRPDYSLFRYAMYFSYTEDRIAEEGNEYSFFPIPNVDLTKESSLFIEWISRADLNYRFYAISKYSGFKVYLSPYWLSNQILNHVGTSLPTGSANKEFIRTLGDNYIIWDHSKNTVRGSRPTKFGYEGDSTIECHPIPLEEPTDNGKAWAVNSWFDFVDVEMYSSIRRYTMFLDLLEQAGLFNPVLNEFPFLGWWNNYTIFVPSEQALSDHQVDTLSDEELEDFLRYHFVDGDLIFTDNKMPEGEYWTTAEKSIYIRPGRDIIEILDTTGIPYVTIAEKEYVTNRMVTRNSEVTAVIHEIDAVLTPSMSTYYYNNRKK